MANVTRGSCTAVPEIRRPTSRSSCTYQRMNCARQERNRTSGAEKPSLPLQHGSSKEINLIARYTGSIVQEETTLRERGRSREPYTANAMDNKKNSWPGRLLSCSPSKVLPPLGLSSINTACGCFSLQLQHRRKPQSINIHET